MSSNIPNNLDISLNVNENLNYIDKDNYYFKQEIKNKKVHQVVYSFIMLIFLFITFRIIYLRYKSSNIPYLVYILYCTFVIVFYLFYYKLSIYLTDLILLFYIPNLL
jgi:uncharacterized protein YacL